VQLRYELVFLPFSHKLMSLSKKALYFKRSFSGTAIHQMEDWRLNVVGGITTISAVLVVVVLLRI